MSATTPPGWRYVDISGPSVPAHRRQFVQAAAVELVQAAKVDVDDGEWHGARLCLSGGGQVTTSLDPCDVVALLEPVLVEDDEQAPLGRVGFGASSSTPMSPELGVPRPAVHVPG